jgi:hypothetical protein
VPPAESTGMEVDSVAVATEGGDAGGVDHVESGACDEQGGIVVTPTEPFDPVQAKTAFELHMRGEPPAAVPACSASGRVGGSASSASSSADGPAVLGRERSFVRMRAWECTTSPGERVLPPPARVITWTAGGGARNRRSLPNFPPSE